LQKEEEVMKALSFDDVLLVDKFSEIASRKDVDPSVTLLGVKLGTPVVSSNMMCVTDAKMALTVRTHGGVGCLPRFWSIDDNVAIFKESPPETFVSIGLGKNELDRASALFKSGASAIVLDVAQGANAAVVHQVKALREIVKGNAAIMVGNFSNLAAYSAFQHHLGWKVDAIKVGIGGGSACITRVVTGCGMPTFASIVDLKGANVPMVADGGIRTSGDLVKAIAAGATAVMCGKLFAATLDSPAEVRTAYVRQSSVEHGEFYEQKQVQKKYSGSASAESYDAQGKAASWRAPEGESYWIPATGTVENLMQTLDGGLRSGMSYNNALTIADLQKNAEFVEVTQNGAKENSAHGKH
jgi:IMP dehydrogenase